MQNISPNTLFLGQQLIYLPHCDSTNRIASDLLIKNKATEGCVIITDKQTQGRGQRDNTWEAEPHKNITLSVVLKPSFISVPQHFFFNIAVSLALLDLTKYYLPNYTKIKWPNDIYYKNKKLGGILIENNLNGHFLQHSIVGIGLNINQLIFSNSGAISFAQITQQEYALAAVIEKLLEFLEARYLTLRHQDLTKLRFEYLQNLYRYQEDHDFLINNSITKGRILGIDDSGRLSLQINDKVQSFDLKQISYVI